MRALFRFSLVASLLVWCSYAQRGGGHAGGGGFHGGGGGFRGGSVGGGFRGGSVGGFRGGSVGTGFRSGGFSGVRSTVGNYGGIRGGNFGFNRGGNFGFNRGGNFGFNRGFDRGFGWNRGFRYGYGFGAGYWPSWGWGWGWPYYGLGWGLSYWPWYGGYWDSPYDYGYAGYDPGVYASYTPSSNVTVVYPQTVGSAPSQGYSDTAHPVTRSYDQYGQEVRPSGPGEAASPIYLIAMKDGVIRAASSYRVENGTLHYTTLQNEEKSVPVSSIDRTLTNQLNRERRVNLNLGQ